MHEHPFAVLLIVLGAGLILAGALIATGLPGCLGRLPGDIRFQGEHIRIYFPMTTCVLFSLLLTILSYLVRRFF